MPGTGRGVRSGLGLGSSETGTQGCTDLGVCWCHVGTNCFIDLKMQMALSFDLQLFPIKNKQTNNKRKRIAFHQKSSEPLTGSSFIKMHPWTGWTLGLHRASKATAWSSRCGGSSKTDTVPSVTHRNFPFGILCSWSTHSMGQLTCESCTGNQRSGGSCGFIYRNLIFCYSSKK